MQCGGKKFYKSGWGVCVHRYCSPSRILSEIIHYVHFPGNWLPPNLVLCNTSAGHLDYTCTSSEIGFLQTRYLVALMPATWICRRFLTVISPTVGSTHLPLSLNRASSTYTEVAAVSVRENSYCPNVFTSTAISSSSLIFFSHTGFWHTQTFSLLPPSATVLSPHFWLAAVSPVWILPSNAWRKTSVSYLFFSVTSSELYNHYADSSSFAHFSVLELFSLIVDWRYLYCVLHTPWPSLLRKHFER